MMNILNYMQKIKQFNNVVNCKMVVVKKIINLKWWL